jgi:prepilin-type N-terminal cleavage/methylation domain-containing protein
MKRAHAEGGRGAPDFGFTLVEAAIVLVIVGVILGIGTSAWMTMNDAREITLTSNRMRAAKNCLITKVVISHQYPDWTSGYASPSTAAVDDCMEERLDAWDQEIRFLEGFRTGGASLADGCLLMDQTLPDNHPCGADNAPVEPATGSTATDADGNTVNDVAFVLISFGEDRTADDAGYGNQLPGGTFATTMSATPDFSSNDDDVFLIVTYPDLLAAIARSEQ